MHRTERIEQAIKNIFSIEHLEVIDESSLHHVPEDAQTHFKVCLVSNDFNGQSRIARHRAVNDSVAEEFKSGLHALALHLYTPEEWQKTTNPASPKCHGGFKHD